LCFNGFLSADYQVLDSGRLKEYGEPYILLQNPESLFYKMVQQLGKGEAAALTETAKQVSAPRSCN
jgi:ATP-binding cassette subfamily C (CFTR/MRP) protein 4